MPESANPKKSKPTNPKAPKSASTKKSKTAAQKSEITHSTLLPSDLLLGDFDGNLTVHTFDQLIFLGRNNLTYFKKRWQHALATAKPFLQQLENRIILLKDKTVADLQRLATQYDCPDYPVKTVHYANRTVDSLTTEDPSAPQRVAGSTTFNICGWCQHALCEGYPISHSTVEAGHVFHPSCGFLDFEWKKPYYHQFNFPCLLTHCDDATLDQIRTNLQAQYQEYLAYYTSIEERIKLLKKLIKEAEPKPLFPDFRPLKHYAKGTPVYFFKSNYDLDNTPSLPYPFYKYLGNPNFTILRGTIKGYEDYEYFEGSIHFQPAGTSAEKDIRIITCTDSELISFEELAYLVEHPDYARIWFASLSTPCLTQHVVASYQHNRYLSTV